MARGLFRKISFNKIVGAYRSQWKRFWLRLFTFGAYGRKGMGWWRDPKKAWYNWWYHRTSVSIPHLLGYKPSWAVCFCAMLVASVIGVVAAPVDAVKAGVEARRSRTDGGSRSASGGEKTAESPRTDKKRTGSGSTDGSAGSASHSSTADFARPPESKTNPAPHTTKADPSPQTSKVCDDVKVSEASSGRERVFTSEVFDRVPVRAAEPVTEPAEASATAVPDEKTPKSKPRREGDQYIRKRMIVAGSSYCDAAALDALSVGDYFEFLPEPTNASDKQAIMLMRDGKKIGYVAAQDKTTFLACFRLKRKTYGVITDIIREPQPTRYEYEAWFEPKGNLTRGD